MTRRPYLTLVIILLLVAVAAWVDLSKQIIISNPFNGSPLINRNVDLRLGLDLRGGLQVLLQADLPTSTTVSATDLSTEQQILMSRANALGVSEVVMQAAPPNRIIAQFPGLTNSDQVVASLQETGVLEFVDLGNTRLPEGTVIETDYRSAGAGPNGIVTETPTSVASPTPLPTDTATPAATTPGATPQATATAAAPAPIIYHTVMAGTSLNTVEVTTGSAVGTSGYVINFTLKPDATTSFGDYTGSHIGQILAIVLDKKIISAPSINAKIDKGQGYIEGNFTSESANALAINLRYGSLPVPVKVVESQTVGATLGADSIRRSLIAGIIGLLAVILFMLLYYRLPGFIADLALITYACISLMLFKLIPVVLSLPGIAGFILGIGMAVDANILIFERLKEELRAGRTLRQAIDLGWSRAWPSIRDANISTLITCLILFIFGNTFGASMVKGFSITLALGVIVSLFTSIIVTRTFLHVVLDRIKFTEHPRWFGITEGSR
jgi:preprotein translocase subunit SecD